MQCSTWPVDGANNFILGTLKKYRITAVAEQQEELLLRSTFEYEMKKKWWATMSGSLADLNMSKPTWNFIPEMCRRMEKTSGSARTVNSHDSLKTLRVVVYTLAYPDHSTLEHGFVKFPSHSVFSRSCITEHDKWERIVRTLTPKT